MGVLLAEIVSGSPTHAENTCKSFCDTLYPKSDKILSRTLPNCINDKKLEIFGLRKSFTEMLGLLNTDGVD
jgi:hypothetical protein